MPLSTADSTTDAGPFTLIATFIKDCEPKCDGSFCGDDSCGGACGVCDEGDECNGSDGRCYLANCQPQCAERECGEDGCGGLCGTCSNNLFCLGVSITSEEEDEATPTSTCTAFAECDHFHPTCDGCTDSQLCGSDCLCYDSPEDLPDLVVVESDMLEEMYLHDVDFPATSCALVENCINAPGLRRLLRFTSTILNQGHADLSFPEPKDRPDLFGFGPCHQHYHFHGFASYSLLDQCGKTLVLGGEKFAYCMEDTARGFDGAAVNCDKTYDCGFQGISKGWVDQYGWSLDCSWIDVTDLAPGTYALEIAVNPNRVFAEVSFDNNKATVLVEIPEADLGSVAQPMRLQTTEFTPTCAGFARFAHGARSNIAVLFFIAVLVF